MMLKTGFSAMSGVVTVTNLHVRDVIDGIRLPWIFALSAMVLCWADNAAGQTNERRPGVTSGADDFPTLDLPKLSGDAPAADRSSKGRTLPPAEAAPSESRRRPIVPLEESRTLDPVDPRSFDEPDSRSPGGSLIRRQPRDPFDRPVENPLPDEFPASDRNRPQQPNTQPESEGFDWTLQPLSIADIGIGSEWQLKHAPWVFEHGKANLTETEIQDYIELIRLAGYRRQTPMRFPEGVNVTSMWESAFYKYEEARRQAWLNGIFTLQQRSDSTTDPFGSGSAVFSKADLTFNSTGPKRYSLQLDMKSHPADFVGRPVVLYGLFKPFGSVELKAVKTIEGEDSVYRLQRGYLWNLQNTETIAMVDAISYVDAESQNKPSQAWRTENRVAVPVLVKGWFIKLWQKQPLLFTDVVRILSPRPYDSYIRDHVKSRVKVRDDEGWLFYETLRQLQLTRRDYQESIALKEQQIRVAELLKDVQRKAVTEKQTLEQQFRNGAVSKNSDSKSMGYEERSRQLERQLAVRESRYQKYQAQPETFPMFVDVFQNPDRWQGRLVTLRGHVRRVSTYPGDATLFDGQPLHELWLFTDDSQHNPAVIVTPTLPRDFPTSADAVDSVSVTGCFFKMYVYRSQAENRLAPLFLAGSVTWSPTDDQILQLAKDGHIAKTTALFRTAQAQHSRVSDTMILMFGFLLLIMAMTAWGHVQRDRREQKRLMALVDERPDFRQTSQDLFSGPFADPRIESSRG
jgi:hypothetical protein